jgi:Na+-transporting NADH:ubiquinone oxidoreductase subunit NqrE
MRLFVTVLLGGVVSFALGFALVFAVSEWLPRPDDRASCGMGQAYSIIAVMIFAPLVMLVFGFAVWRSASERAIAIAAITLLAPIVGVLLFAMILNGMPRDIMRELYGLLEFYVPLVLIVGVQWAVLRVYMRRPAPKGA